MCVLFDKPTIYCTGDTFKTDIDNIIDVPKFGDVIISLVSVEGKKVIIKIIPGITGTTATDDLEVSDLFVQSKALTCKAGKKMKLEAITGTELECSTSEEIEANLDCKLSGTPKITSTDDSFGSIKYQINTIKSSFGKMKVGLNSIKGTYVYLLFVPEYEGLVKVDITGLYLNETQVISCNEKIKKKILKTRTTIECTISQAIEEENVCLLTESNLYTSMKCNLEIDEGKKLVVARNSKFGKVYISLKYILGNQVILLIKPTVSSVTESSKFTINDLKLHYDTYDKTMSCVQFSKITFPSYGYDFTCTISSSMNGGKECSLKGTPSFISEGDTFSDIIVSDNTILSSFGDISISIHSIIGKTVKLILSSVYTGTTKSVINSINNLKIQNQGNSELMSLTCEINTNIDFSSRSLIFCELGEIVNGNIIFQLKGEEPKIINPDNSKDVFGDINLSKNEVTSSFGKIEISLISVTGKKAVIGLKSQYKGIISGTLRVFYLYINHQQIYCSSSGVSLELTNEAASSRSFIDCYFNSEYYSEETNTSCILTGTPTISPKLFTSQSLTSNNQVQSGVRNFDDTKLYLYSIKGTTIYIEIMPSLSGKVRPKISNLKLQAGYETLDIKCDVTEKIQLYSYSTKRIKCYIQNIINSNTECRLLNEGNNTVSITSDNGDIFGKAYIDTNSVVIKPTKPTYGDSQITLNTIIGTQININIAVSSTTIIDYANPVVQGLYLEGNKLTCIATQRIYFVNNQAQMTCTSSNPITCTDCQLTG